MRRLPNLSWTVTGVSCQDKTEFLQLISDPYIVWDRVQISLTVDRQRIDVYTGAIYTFSTTYEYDGSDAKEYTTIGLNDTLIKTNVGKFTFETAKIVEVKYGLSKFITNTFSVIWDIVKIELSVSDNRIDIESTGSYN